MARRCAFTGVDAQAGNNVSHSNRKTRRRFLPNIKELRLRSDALKQDIKLKVTAATLRSIEHNGGLDAYLLNTRSARLSEEALRLKRRVQQGVAKQAA